MSRRLKARAPQPCEGDTRGRPRAGKLQALCIELEDLRCRVAWLEAELSRRHRPRCPRCDAAALEVVARRPHPEFGFAAMEEHEVRCTACGHAGVRLHDPRRYLR